MNRIIKFLPGQARAQRPVNSSCASCERGRAARAGQPLIWSRLGFMIIRADTDLCAMNRGGHPRACVPTSRIPPVKFKLKSASPPLLCVACRVANSKKKKKKGARSPRRGRVRHLALRSEEIDVPGVRLPSTPGHTQARRTAAVVPAAHTNK